MRRQTERQPASTAARRPGVGKLFEGWWRNGLRWRKETNGSVGPSNLKAVSAADRCSHKTGVVVRRHSRSELDRQADGVALLAGLSLDGQEPGVRRTDQEDGPGNRYALALHLPQRRALARGGRDHD